MQNIYSDAAHHTRYIPSENITIILRIKTI